MRVRILKSVITAYGTFQAGTVQDIPDEIARKWCKVGIAYQDTSLDGGKETKEGYNKGGQNA